MTPPEEGLALLARGRSAEGPWVVVDKPSGWHTLAGRSGGATVEAGLRNLVPECAGLPEAGLVHRLDLGTSGCLLAATTASGRTRWRERWSRVGGRGVAKTYLAIAEASADAMAREGGGASRELPSEGGFELHFRSRYRRSAKVTVTERGPAETRGECRWRVEERRGRRVRLSIELIGPGRRHQIRAGLAWLGFPLVGDELYGGPGADRLHLHAWRLAFDETIVESPPPSSW